VILFDVFVGNETRRLNCVMCDVIIWDDKDLNNFRLYLLKKNSQFIRTIPTQLMI
jgi:hypothetical protein